MVFAEKFDTKKSKTMSKAHKKLTKDQEENLDPKDMHDFRAQAHELLDACIDRLENVKDLPWKPVDIEAQKKLMPALPQTPKHTKEIIEELKNNVMPYATGNTHPKFFGWVHGTGVPTCLLAEMVASTMNSNCGGRDHGAIYVERCVIEWCKEIFSFPEEAGGLLTVGTSHATIIALVTARTKILGLDVRETGIQDLPKIAVYCAQGAHACVKKALQVMGHGTQALREIPTHGASGGMDIKALKRQISQDKENHVQPLCVVATAGSVNTGAFDDMNAIADICLEHGLWMHVDGAFGAWARIADDPWRGLTNGIERADSIAFDFHKWMSIQYDCGAVLIRDSKLHYDSFATRPAYLAAQAEGLGGGDLWFCDLGTDLSRGFRALKVWTALQNHGLGAFSQVITQNCMHAAYMEECVEKTEGLELATSVVSNVCTFFVISKNKAEQDTLNERIVHALQLSGEVVFSTTKIEGRTAIRAAIVNHRTTYKDIEESVNAVEKQMLSPVIEKP